MLEVHQGFWLFGQGATDWGGNMLKYAIAGLISALGLAGCTSHLKISKMPETGPVTGVPYALYFDQFDMVAKYRLTECQPLTLAISVEATKQARVPDPNQVYLIDPLSLGGFLKTTEFDISYNPDGSVSALNAKADDKSAEAISGLVKSAAGVAKIILAGGASATEAANQVNVCNEDTNKKLAAYKVQEETVKKASQSLDAAKVDFDLWMAKVDAVGGNPDQALQTAFNNSYRNYDIAARSLASAKAALDAMGGKLTYPRAFSWPESGDDVTKKLPFDLAFAQEVFGPWLLNGGGSVTDQASKLKPYDIHIALVAADKSRLSDPSGGATLDATQLAAGIPFRSAAPAILKADRPFALDDKDKPAPESLLAQAVSVQQFGRIFQLPCHNPPFTASACSLAFSADGRLTKAGASRSKAQGEVLANLLSGTVDQASGIAEASRARDLRIAGKPKAEAEAELAMLELEAKLAAARKSLTVAPQTDREIIEDQILDLDVERKLIEAKLALDKARAQTTP